MYTAKITMTKAKPEKAYSENRCLVKTGFAYIRRSTFVVAGDESEGPAL